MYRWGLIRRDRLRSVTRVTAKLAKGGSETLRGRKPLPRILKLIRGNPGHRAISDEPQPLLGSINPPKYLSRGAKKIWREVAPELYRLGLLTILDRQALARYSALHARWMEAEQFLEEKGSVYPIKDDQGKIKYLAQFPQVSMMRNYAKLANSLGLEFGLTASARVRLHVEPLDPEESKDKRFFG